MSIIYPLVVTFVIAVLYAPIDGSEQPTPTQSNLFPFGVSAGDYLVPTGDDVASDVSTLREQIAFFGSHYRRIVVNSNGVLSLGGVSFTSFGLRPFPLSSPVAIIAPFWFDLNPTRGGSISYRQSNDSELLRRMSSLVQAVNDGELVDFHPTLLFIATWYQVPHIIGPPEINNTFQVVLGTDTSRTVSLFIYDDIRSGSGAQIGFNAGDGITSFTLPEALTSLTLDMEQRSNIGLPGVFIYRLDNLGSVMCSSLPGCGSYDLGNTTLADCCGRSTVGLFYTLLGTEDCSPCDDGMVECSSYLDCRAQDLGTMTAEECCVINPRGLSFVRSRIGEGPRCHMCSDNSDLFPFGVSVGDSLVPPGDDIASDISTLKDPITFFGSQYREVIVSSNGVLSLGGVPFTDFNRRPFPLLSRVDVTIIAPFWFDLNPTRGGSISYRQSNDSVLLRRMSSLVQALNDRELVDFHPTQLFIATWYQVPPFNGLPEMNNTFQVVLGTDTLRTVSLFIYDDIQSGSGAQIGFNAGDGITSFTLPEALTSLTLDMEQRSNIGLPGVFIYRLDNLGSVMCSSIDGCTSYDLGNTTLVDCCSESTKGMFYTFPGTQNCNPCYRGMVQCSSSLDCSTPDFGVVTAEECCVHTPGGLAFNTIGVPQCHVCIVVGWFQDTFIGVEREERYELFVGIRKGQQEFTEPLVEIFITSSLDAVVNVSNVATEFFDYIIEDRFITPEIQPFTVGVTFLIDNVALEFNEIAVLEILEPAIFLDIRAEPGFFFRRRLEITIVDANVLDISFAAISYQVNESSDVTVEVCKRDLIAREYLNPVAVFLSTFTIDNFVGETLLFDIPPDNPFSPTRANADDFEVLSMVPAFLFFPDEFDAANNIILAGPENQCQHANIYINDDDINEADQIFFVKINVAPELEYRITTIINVSLINIIDNDDIIFRFEQASYTFFEPPMIDTYPIFLLTDNVHRETEQTFNVTFEAFTCNFSTSLKPASFEEDLYALQNTERIVDPNISSIQRTQYDIELFPDDVTELAECFCVSSCVSVLSGGQPCQFYAETVIIIVDPDTPVGFSRSLVITGEDYDAVSIFVFAYIPVEDLEIEFTTHSGNATEGEDYEGAVDMPVHFVNGSNFVVITVNIVDDNLTEGVESFTGVLTVTDPADPTLSFNTSITVEILDNDDVGVCGNTFMGRNCSEDALCYLSKDDRLIQSCLCQTGYIGDGFLCEDIDECATNTTHNCSVEQNERCVNVEGSYRCECATGFVKLSFGESCEDIDECEGNYNCSDNERCVNTIGSFSCLCEAGYTRMNSSGLCQNIDECSSEILNDCSNISHRVCQDTLGSFECLCDQGYQKSFLGECENIDECDDDEISCSQRCQDTDGSFYCFCESGFFLDGSDDSTCHDIDECDIGIHDCDANAECINTVGSFDCVCDRVHQGDGRACQVSESVIIGSSLGVVLFIVIIGVVLVLVGVSFWCAKRSRHQNDTIQKENKIPTNPINLNDTDIVRGLFVNSSYKLKLPPHLVLPSSCIKIVEPIGQGEFGIVYKGYIMRNQGQVVSDIVAIKTLKGFYDSSAVKEMLKECARMYTFNHPNVLTLKGVCVDGGPTPYIIMPFMANGSLLAYLKKERAKLVVSNEDLDAEEVESVSKQLMDMCIQIARGMEYVARKKVVHRDLAARNCMIDVNFVIKVADFGLCESLETKEYFRQDKAAAVKLPVKWLAPESMEDYVFSEKSDVWAYGVTCWEIFSGGKVPYPNMDLMELPKLLRNGLRLDRPENGACNEEMYKTMLQCWEINADKRPTFSALVELLSKDLEVMANYLVMQNSSTALSHDLEVIAEAERRESCQQLEHSTVNLIDSSVSEVKVTIENNQ